MSDAKPSGETIDAHQHYWRYDAAGYPWIDESMAVIRRDFLPRDAKCEMDRAGIGGTIAVQARQTLEETRWLLDLAREHPFVRGVVGWIDLQQDVDAQLAGFAEDRALAGVRHIVQAEPDGFLQRPRFLSGVARLEPAGLAYDILVYARQLPQAIEFARRFPRQRFVLDHLGKPDVRGGEFDGWRQGLRELAALPNVCCKLSGLVTEADWHGWTPGQLRPYLDAALDAFGPDRIMIGSDWPVCLVAATYAEVIALVRDAVDEYSPAEQQRMLGGTAREFWNLGGL
ncbi:MAG TPA: amidohydrolase family protein [Vicinamibacterales bacterium]|nr:amidohydrolase family protein [Vicinamibacterales bacterium]